MSMPNKHACNRIAASLTHFFCCGEAHNHHLQKSSRQVKLRSTEIRSEHWQLPIKTLRKSGPKIAQTKFDTRPGKRPVLLVPGVGVACAGAYIFGKRIINILNHKWLFSNLSTKLYLPKRWHQRWRYRGWLQLISTLLKWFWSLIYFEVDCFALMQLNVLNCGWSRTLLL